MAFSDTVSETIFDTRKVIDHAFRRAKVPPQKITREYIKTAYDLLYMELSRLANKGLALWAMSNHILPLYYGEQTVPCPLGTVDILNANLRKLTRIAGDADSSEGDADNAFDEDIETACIQTVAAGWISCDFDTESQITNFGILPGATGAWNFTIEVSDDNATWRVVYTSETDQAMVDGEWFWWDVEGLVPVQYMRLKATGSTVLDVRELVFANTPQEIPIAKINRDDYMNLPNKTFLGRPTEFYYDKQIRIPSMVVWPAPQEEYTFQQLVITTQRYVMDVGTMTQELEIPQGWYLAIVTTLAYNLCMEIPEAPPDQAGVLFPEMSRLMTDAWAGQTDSSPTRISPNISPYTR